MYFIVRHGVRKHKERVKARQGERLQETEGATAQTGEPGDAELAERGTDANRKKRDGPILEPGNTDSSAQPATDVAVNIPAAEPGDVETEKKKKQKEDLSPEEIAAKKRRRVYRWKISFGLFFPFALQALDTTIIASALPYIATDFHQVKQLNWIVSTFNLTSCAFLPFWAQLTDIFGRHNAVQAAVVLVLIGSAICTGSPTSSFGVLLLGRSLQGVGAAGVNISIRTILADRVSLRDYALNWTIFALVSGISFSIGPIIGGFLTRASWRWCFGINLPIAPAAIIVVFLLLRKDLLGPQPLRELEGHDISTRRGRLLARLSTIDYGGQMLFLWGLGLLCLAFTWAGGTFPWHSAAVLAPLIIGSIMSIGWVLYEFSMSPGRVMARILPYQRAMIPWELLSHRDIGLLFYINCTVGMSMFAVMYFMDLYFALVEKKSSSNAGIGLLYFLPGLGSKLTLPAIP
ncbi:hypothetical protein DH86_00003663 [Scytalidium sp. 3C]|nr:hypothetical protein DH86_00003663 [Scytalidium sp. 3C]